MDRFTDRALGKLREKKAQILLPSVLLAPIFILVIYLLFETAKVSMTKVRHQFALDNAAYTQMSAASTYLNAVAIVNGPLPYRVMLYYAESQGNPLKPTKTAEQRGRDKNLTIFELFYKGGGVPTIADDYERGINDPPKAESVDWGVRYYDGPELDDGASRKDWEKEQPRIPSGDNYIPMMSRKLVNDYYFPAHSMAVGVIQSYLETYVRVGSVYESQSYVYKEVSKNAVMFREAYYLNTNDCKKSDCARESSAKIRQFTALQTKPVELDKVRFYASDSGFSGEHGGAIPLDLPMVETIKTKLFQFAYLDASSRSKLRQLARGVQLKQSFKLPKNHFNINLEQKYKPYVRNEVVLSCPRGSNNCVWPNPLPKYNVTLNP